MGALPRKQKNKTKPVGDQRNGKGPTTSGTHVNDPKGIASDLAKLILDPEKAPNDVTTLITEARYRAPNVPKYHPHIE